MVINLLVLFGLASAPPQVSHPKVPQFDFSVKEYGAGPPLIFIPGLACGGGVWDPTVEALKGRYHCYVLTLPGFGGVKPIDNRPLLRSLRNEVISYIEFHHLEKPIIIGHSLGGFLAWWIAEKDSKNLGGIVAVDGVPYLPAISLPTMTVKMMMPYKQQIYNSLAKPNNQKFVSSEEESLGAMITHKRDISFVEACSGPPDQTTTAECMTEMMMTDLRPRVSRIQCPAFLMMSGKEYKGNSSAMEASYLEQVKGVKKLTFKDFQDSLHFIMLDQPKEFMAALTGFLSNVEVSSKGK